MRAWKNDGKSIKSHLNYGDEFCHYPEKSGA
jgi:hypothetical protein